MHHPNKSILDTIGGTPLVEISSAVNGGAARILAKAEYFNPGGSIKDRVAMAMVSDAEETGRIKKGDTIVEPTSGNTGVGLALVCAVKGYRLVLTMPESMSIERQRLAKAYGAEIALTPAKDGMKGAIAKAEEIAKERGGIILQQFENAANPLAHELGTGPEIWNGCQGEIDIFVSAVGTGGTLTGTARYLKGRKPGIRVVAVEPAESPVLSGGEPGPHRIQGIGAGFIPPILQTGLIDEVIRVDADDAGKTARMAARSDGLLVGISSGAALHAAIGLSKREENCGKTIVAILPDNGERYLSTWLFA